MRFLIVAVTALAIVAFTPDASQAHHDTPFAAANR